MGRDPLAFVDGTLTVLWFWLEAQTVLTFISHVSLQVFRKLVLMFTIYALPAEVQMFSFAKCLQPTRIAVEWATGCHVFAQSHGRSLRVVASAVGRWSSRIFSGAQQSWCSLNP